MFVRGENLQRIFFFVADRRKKKTKRCCKQDVGAVHKSTSANRFCVGHSFFHNGPSCSDWEFTRDHFTDQIQIPFPECDQSIYRFLIRGGLSSWGSDITNLRFILLRWGEISIHEISVFVQVLFLRLFHERFFDQFSRHCCGPLHCHHSSPKVPHDYDEKESFCNHIFLVDVQLIFICVSLYGQQLQKR